MTKKSDPSLIFIILETPNPSSFTFPLIATLRVSRWNRIYSVFKTSAGIRAEWKTRQIGI